MFRLALQRVYKDELTAFEKQNAKVESELKKSIISTSSDQLRLGVNTILPISMLTEMKTAALSHFYRISDYIELGPNVWYTVEDNHIIFHDGKDDPESRDGPIMTHYR